METENSLYIIAIIIYIKIKNKIRMPDVTIIIWHYTGNSRYKTYNHKKWITMIWGGYGYMLKNSKKKKKPMANY